MIEQQIEDLKNALREVMALITQRNQPLGDDLKLLLAQVMEHVANRIQQLRQEETQGVPTPPSITPPEPEAAPFESAQVNAFKYDPDSQDLYVKFQDKYPQQNGPVYKYQGVPKFIYDVFRRGGVGPLTTGSNAWHAWKEGVTPSLGAALNGLIKAGGYQYQRLS